MPFTARALATPLSYAAPQIYEGSPDDEVLESLAFADLTGVLRQLVNELGMSESANLSAALAEATAWKVVASPVSTLAAWSSAEPDSSPSASALAASLAAALADAKSLFICCVTVSRCSAASCCAK